jgi:hypothetical protein
MPEPKAFGTVIDVSVRVEDPVSGDSLADVILTFTTMATASASDSWQLRFRASLYKYVPPALIVTGTVLNVLTIIVLIQRKFGKSSTRILLIVLALADTAVLWTGLMRKWVEDFGIDIRRLNKVSCPLHVFCSYLFLHFSAWVVMLITVERWISVSFPLKANLICTTRSTCAAITVSAAILLALNSHILVYYRLSVIFIDRNGVIYHSCSRVSISYTHFWTRIWPWVTMLAYTGIPFSVICVCNSCILYKVIQGQRARKMLQNPRMGPDGLPRLVSLTYMLTTVSCVFLLLTLPVSLQYLIDAIKREFSISWSQNVHGVRLTYAATNLIAYINNTINFLLYCISGSQFRREVYLMFSGLGRQTQHHPVRAP